MLNQERKKNLYATSYQTNFNSKHSTNTISKINQQSIASLFPMNISGTHEQNLYIYIQYVQLQKNFANMREKKKISFPYHML